MQCRKSKSEDGACNKSPYMYTQQLQFLKDTLAPNETVNSLDPKPTRSSVEVDEAGPSTALIKDCSSTSWKKRLLHSAE